MESRRSRPARHARPRCVSARTWEEDHCRAVCARVGIPRGSASWTADPRLGPRGNTGCILESTVGKPTNGADWTRSSNLRQSTASGKVTAFKRRTYRATQHCGVEERYLGSLINFRQRVRLPPPQRSRPARNIPLHGSGVLPRFGWSGGSYPACRAQAGLQSQLCGVRYFGGVRRGGNGPVNLPPLLWRCG